MKGCGLSTTARFPRYCPWIIRSLCSAMKTNWCVGCAIAGIWCGRRQLPLYADTLKKRGNYAHFGPVLAGGRIYVAGSDGQLRGFDPLTGELAVSIHIPMGAGSFPVDRGRGVVSCGTGWGFAGFSIGRTHNKKDK